jgi:hypothetical protein
MVNASNSRFLYLRSLRPGVSLGCLLSARTRMVRSADEDDVLSILTNLNLEGR